MLKAANETDWVVSDDNLCDQQIDLLVFLDTVFHIALSAVKLIVERLWFAV